MEHGFYRKSVKGYQKYTDTDLHFGLSTSDARVCDIREY